MSSVRVTVLVRSSGPPLEAVIVYVTSVSAGHPATLHATLFATEMSAFGDGDGGTAAAGGALATTLRLTRNDAMVATESSGRRTTLARGIICPPFIDLLATGRNGSWKPSSYPNRPIPPNPATRSICGWEHHPQRRRRPPLA